MSHNKDWRFETDGRNKGKELPRKGKQAIKKVKHLKEVLEDSEIDEEIKEALNNIQESL